MEACLELAQVRRPGQQLLRVPGRAQQQRAARLPQAVVAVACSSHRSLTTGQQGSHIQEILFRTGCTNPSCHKAKSSLMISVAIYLGQQLTPASD